MLFKRSLSFYRSTYPLSSRQGRARSGPPRPPPSTRAWTSSSRARGCRNWRRSQRYQPTTDCFPLTSMKRAVSRFFFQFLAIIYDKDNCYLLYLHTLNVGEVYWGPIFEAKMDMTRFKQLSVLNVSHIYYLHTLLRFASRKWFKYLIMFRTRGSLR